MNENTSKRPVSSEAAFTSLSINEIAHLIPSSPSFTSKQIFKWIASGATSFNQMTNLPLHVRSTLECEHVLYSTQVETMLTDPDGTIKLQIKLHDGFMVETVLLIDADGRKTACVSCQAGCAMGCAFCKTATLGLARNLTTAEIIEQFYHLEKHAGTLQNIVFMGMGEPLMNLESIRKTLVLLSDKNGRNLSMRRVTLSTCGIVDGIYDLADNGPIIKLAISLTTADEEQRKTLMPITNGNSLESLSKAIEYYNNKTGKRITLEVPLLGNSNTSLEHVQKLINFSKKLPVHLNLIPWNPVEGIDYVEPTKNEVKKFQELLEKAGFNVTVRMKRGRTIGGACGQLGKT